MTPEYAVDILHSLILQSLILVGPLLVTAVVMGVAISLIQTVTSIQDQTLTFVPKIFGLGLVGMLLSPWMLGSMMEVTRTFFMRIVDMSP